MTAKFVAEDGPLKGLELPLENGTSWIIGRDPEFCQLLVEDASVSRKHVLCTKSSEGIIVENLSLTNKTFINDEEIKNPHLLQDSDFLKIGEGSYRFYAENPDNKAETNKTEITTESTENSKIENSAETNQPINGHSDMQNDMQKPAEENEEIEIHPENKQDINDEYEQEDSIFQEASASSSDDLANINFEYGETGRFLLKVISGLNNGAEFPMQTDKSYIIGSDSFSSDIIFNDNSVSRQHVKLTIDPENKIFIEDLKSRNGTLVNGEPIKERVNVDHSAMITVGTTSFVIYDRESAMQTVISPLMPSIVKMLQQKEESSRKEHEEREKQKALSEAAAAAELATAEELEKQSKKPTGHNLSFFILTGMITGLFVLSGIAMTTLFKSEPVIKEQNIDTEALLAKALSAFPNVKYNFNKATGVLLLAGHVSTSTDKNQLLYNIQGLKFVKTTDDAGVIIDEFAWREINPTLNKNPAWRGVSIQSPAPGKFVLSGYLQTRRESEQLWDYVSNNFAYINLLEKKVIVEEDVISKVNSLLINDGFKDVKVQMSQGELTLTGFIPTGRGENFIAVVSEMKNILGVREIRNYVAEIPAEQSMINLTDRYEVTGHSQQGKGNISVIINGRVLSRGDMLDGMLITSVKPNIILLEKDAVKYRIDYTK